MKKNKSKNESKFNRGDWHEKEKKTHKGIIVCSNCSNTFYGKNWRAQGVVDLKEQEKLGNEIIVELCPACKMIKENMYAGELVIEKFPKKYEVELASLIDSFGKNSEGIDPQHRIIKVEKKPLIYRITTTENQMVQRLAKKIKSAFKNFKEFKENISYSKEPYKTERVYMVYEKEK